MEPGNVVEYIDNQKILCAVVLEVKDKRLRLLMENNREVNLSVNRLSHKGKTLLKLSMGRDKLLESLKETAQRRKELMRQVDVKELWEVLHSEEEPVSLVTMAELCFTSPPASDHESAVVRAFFENRIYFKFDFDSFTPNSEKQVETLLNQQREEERKSRLLEDGGKWLKAALAGNTVQPSSEIPELIHILQSYYLFGKESPHYSMGKAICARAEIDSDLLLFKLFVKLGLWTKNENLDLQRLNIPISFSEDGLRQAKAMADSSGPVTATSPRKDLSSLSIFTIDGQSTLDFDDALSIEPDGMNYRVGVHIIDVGHYIKKGDPLDKEAMTRASSIYMPDQKIPMLPPELSENICSLKANAPRPAITIQATLSPLAQVIDYDIFPSMITVKRQLTYSEADANIDHDEEIRILHDLAQHFRQHRLSSGAIQIILPEINLQVSEANGITLYKMDREGPGRLLVSEMMILANWLMAKFLSDRKLPAIFRSQPDPKNRILKNGQGTIFDNWMQRKMLSRGILGPTPENHSGLGLDAYVTATSPIRKYFDLATQRQIRSAFGLEEAYTEKEIEEIIQTIDEPVRTVGRLQYQRQRYWILKYLEKRTGAKENAIVVDKRRNMYTALMLEYMTECSLATSSGVELKPGDFIQVTIQHANARNDTLSVFMG